MGERVQGGRLAARAIAAEGVDTIFTLSGGHVMPIYEGCRHEGVRVVDVRHEQSAGTCGRGVGQRPPRVRRRPRHRGPGRDRHGHGRRELLRGPDAACRARRRAAARAGRAGRPAGVRPALADEADHEVGRGLPLDRTDPGVRGDRISPGARGAARAGLPRAADRHPLRRRRARTVPVPSRRRRAVGRRAARRSRGRPTSSPRPSARRSWRVAASGGTAAPRRSSRFAAARDVPVYLNGSGRGSLPPTIRFSSSTRGRHALEEADVVCVSARRSTSGSATGRSARRSWSTSTATRASSGATASPEAADRRRLRGGARDAVADSCAPAHRAPWLEALRTAEAAWWDEHRHEVESEQRAAQPLPARRRARPGARTGDGGDRRRR